MAINQSAGARYGSTLATDPLRSFRFFAEFTPAADAVFSNKITTGFVGGFTSIDGLSINTQALQYREGGYNTTVHQIPGLTTFNPMTFSRGVISGNDQAITWMRGLFAAAAGQGLTPAANNGFRVNIKIYVQNHPGSDIVKNDAHDQMVFTVHNAWITNLSYTNLDATTGQILFESMQLVHEGLSVSFI